MANYSTLKSAIQAVIKQNGNNEITGNLLQSSLLSMINSLGAGFQFLGVATPSTNPGTPDQNVFYIAATAGTYSNFGSIVLADGEVAILKGSGSSWTKETANIATASVVSQLGQKQQVLFTQKLETTLLQGFAINVGSYNVGDVVNTAPVQNSSYSCGLFNWPQAIRHIILKGVGGSLPRLYAFLDADMKLISMADSAQSISSARVVSIPENTSYVVINASITSSTTPIVRLSLQADWNETDSFSNSFILNKPSIFDTIYNVNKQTGNISTIYTLSTATAAIPSASRSGRMIICFLAATGRYDFYQYLVGNTGDSYFYNSSNWEKFSATANDINTAISSMTSDLREEIEPIFFDKILETKLFPGVAISLGSYSVGDVVSLSFTINNSFNSNYFLIPSNIVAFRVTMMGGVGPRAYAFLDADRKLISMASDNATFSNALILVPSNAKIVVFNVLSASSQYPPSIEGETNVEQLVSLIPPSKWVALGDSITYGYVSNPDGTYTPLPREGWVAKMEKITRKVVTNLGAGGAGWAHGENCARNGVGVWIENDVFEGANLVTFAYGVNDWKYNEVLGSMDDPVSSSAVNIIPSMRYVIETLLAAYPNLKIVVISPINCCAYGSKANDWGIGYSFSNNGTLEQVSQAMKTVCEYYGIEFIDMLHSSCVNRENAPSLLFDGVHPSIAAHTLMARELSKKINCF